MKDTKSSQMLLDPNLVLFPFQWLAHFPRFLLPVGAAQAHAAIAVSQTNEPSQESQSTALPGTSQRFLGQTQVELLRSRVSETGCGYVNPSGGAPYGPCRRYEPYRMW